MRSSLSGGFLFLALIVVAFTGRVQADTFTMRVSAGSDDAEQNGSAVSTTTDPHEMGLDRYQGFRFQGVTVPAGAIILEAAIQFTANSADSVGTPKVEIFGQAADNPPTFSTSGSDISNRAVTAESENWDLADWLTAGESGPDQRTPDLVKIVQELVDRPGWSSGNAMAFVFAPRNGDAIRRPETFDGAPAKSPELFIAYYYMGGGAAARSCTTDTLVDKDIFGIAGTDDDNVIAVGKDGTAAQWNGTVWSSMSMPTTEDLLDVSVVGNTAFAVGKHGTIVQLVAGSWVVQTTPTTDDLQGVWTASPTQAWAVGKDGLVLSWDGVSWNDVSVAAQTGNNELTDAWGDATSVWAIEKDGTIYRYDRLAGTWDTPHLACDLGGGRFRDIWGDNAGNLYIVRDKSIYIYDGLTCTQSALSAKQIYGIHGGGGRIVAAGQDGFVLEDDGVTWTETDEMLEDILDDWVSETGTAYYSGKHGEVTICECTDCLNPGFLVVHDGFGIHCLDETVRVDVIDTVTGNPYANYSAQITLDTQTGQGTWSLTAGSGGFNDAVADDGLATYVWPLGETTATFTLSYPEGAPDFDIDAYEISDPAIRDDDSEGNIVFSPSGFSVTAAALSNPPPVIINPFAGPVTAGSDFAIYLAAYGQTPTDPQCGVIEGYTGSQNLKFWSDYIDPGTGTVAVSIDGALIATAEGAAAAQPVVFTDGQASIMAKYKDAGRIRILLKDDSPADPDLPTGIRGATANFVSRPDRFVLSGIADAVANPNPGAANSAGPVFTAAGDPFSVTVTAVDAEGDATPNFGREVTSESVLLTPVLADPVAGNNPAIGLVSGFGTFAGGQASGNDFYWPEVGIIQITPSVADSDYLGTGDVSGTSSANVGRFVPHHFAAALNTPSFDTACAAGSYTYIGQPFSYLVAPVISLTAQAAAGTTTQNYSAAYWKLTNTSLVNRAYAAATGTLDTSGLPSTAADPVVADLTGGLGTLTFSAGAGLAFQRSSPTAPFDADIQLSIDVVDSDGVVATVNPVSFGNPGGIAFNSGRGMRYGRVAIESALGSEVVNLATPMRMQYYLSASTGFVTHVNDSCTDNISMSFSIYAGNLDAGETCVMDSGAPGASSAGCTAPAPAAFQYREPPLAGDFNLFMLAPGSGNDGSVTVDAQVPDWLKYDWDSANAGDENPSGRVTFGIYRGNDNTIYQREIY